MCEHCVGVVEESRQEGDPHAKLLKFPMDTYVGGMEKSERPALLKSISGRARGRQEGDH